MRDRAEKLPATSTPAKSLFDDQSNTEFGGGEELELLRPLLAHWRVSGEASAALRARLSESYRQQFTQQKEEETMKAYGMPQESFGAGYAYAGGDFRLTILEHESLPRRLAAEVAEVARDSHLTRAEFRRDPLGFTRRLFTAYAQMTRRALAQENVGYGLMASLAVVLTLVGAIAALDHNRSRGLLADRLREDLEFRGLITEVPDAQPKPDSAGAGMAKSGNGGGQKAKLEKPGGGGGGGRNEDKPAVVGKLPQATLAPQVLAPDPHPPAIHNPSLPTAATIQADPVLFPPDPRAVHYGDPKSKSTELSSGTGTGGGIGVGTGGGVGSGNGTGYGPGEGYNTGGGPAKIGGGGPGAGGGPVDYDRVFNMREVTRRAQIISRPEPLYTEEARRNQLTGTVTLRLVLNANGSVTNVVAVTRLPDGLTEKAMEAARQIKFTPAEKDGRRVSQYATINYNFNIY
ncbi:MAG: energy transducer TonB [Pyrinomonadaceae bacterium]